MPMPLGGKDCSDQDRPAAALSAVEKERRKENFQEFLSRQHAAQERKRVQMQEVSLQNRMTRTKRLFCAVTIKNSMRHITCRLFRQVLSVSTSINLNFFIFDWGDRLEKRINEHGHIKLTPASKVNGTIILTLD
jgi:hypothetical protein